MYVYAHQVTCTVNMHTHSMCHTSLETERYSVRIKSELKSLVELYTCMERRFTDEAHTCTCHVYNHVEAVVNNTIVRTVCFGPGCGPRL